MPRGHSPDPTCSLCTACSCPLGGRNSECGNQVLSGERSHVAGQGCCSDSKPSDKSGSAVTEQDRALERSWRCVMTGGQAAQPPGAGGGTRIVPEEEHGCILLPVAVHSEADSAPAVFQSANPFACVGHTATF